MSAPPSMTRIENIKETGFKSDDSVPSVGRLDVKEYTSTTKWFWETKKLVHTL